MCIYVYISKYIRYRLPMGLLVLIVWRYVVITQKATAYGSLGRLNLKSPQQQSNSYCFSNIISVPYSYIILKTSLNTVKWFLTIPTIALFPSHYRFLSATTSSIQCAILVWSSCKWLAPGKAFWFPTDAISSFISNTTYCKSTVSYTRKCTVNGFSNLSG